MDDDGGKVEEHARDLVGMGLECVASDHEAVKDSCRVWKSNVLEDGRLCTSGIWRIGCSKLGAIQMSVCAICPITVGKMKNGG